MIERIEETNGFHNGHPIRCPVQAFDCPYLNKWGNCCISDPIKECNDFNFHYETWEDWEEAFESDFDEYG